MTDRKCVEALQAYFKNRKARERIRNISSRHTKRKLLRTVKQEQE
jgi:hypothetical protein